MGTILFLIIGGVAGWISAEIIYGDGLGLVRNVLVGIFGALLGSFIFKFLGIKTTGLIGELITAVAGAVILLYILNTL